MKKRFRVFLAIVLSFALCLTLLAGCGKAPADPDTPDDPTDPGTPTGPDVPPGDKTDAEKLAEFESKLGSMTFIIDSVARTMSGTSQSYNASDPFFFWITIFNMASNHALGSNSAVVKDEKAGTISVPLTVITEYANACFAGISAVPALPDNFGAVSLDKNTGLYVMRYSDLAVSTSTIYKAVNSDGTYTLRISFLPNGGSAYTYDLILVNNTSGSANYPYAISRMVETSRPADSN